MLSDGGGWENGLAQPGTVPLAPPVKCQGIKTRLVGEIARLARGIPCARWVEPFCGSCVVALNLRPPRALLGDSNVHLIRLYRELQAGTLTGALARDYLADAGARLLARGEDYYYEVRERFNRAPASLEFLFLNRACYNGVLRFNRQGAFNVPFCRKPNRFARAYVTKIVHQLDAAAAVIRDRDWAFVAGDFAGVLAAAGPDDVVYADPPYAGRHVDYFNAWTEFDEERLAAQLRALPGRFILSSWHGNAFRRNTALAERWPAGAWHLHTRAHFYHVGPAEARRHPMVEALITNFAPPSPETPGRPPAG